MKNGKTEEILFVRFLVFTLDQYVDMDYSLVYFHHGLTSGNKPPLSWLWGLYKVRTVGATSLPSPGSGDSTR